MYRCENDRDLDWFDRLERHVLVVGAEYRMVMYQARNFFLLVSGGRGRADRVREAMIRAAHAAIPTLEVDTMCKCPTCTVTGSSTDRPDVRSTKLLHSKLDQRQLSAILSSDWFSVRGRSGREYMVHHSGAVRNYCIAVIDYDIPASDRALAMKLLIESDEQLFLAVANTTHRTANGVIQRMLDKRWGNGNPISRYQPEPRVPGRGCDDYSCRACYKIEDQ